MLVVVAYDVRTEDKAGRRRLRRVAKLCQNFGQRVQFSVFECDLNPSEKTALESELAEVINHNEDQVIFVVLGPAEGRGDRVITALGVPYLKMESPCYAF